MKKDRIIIFILLVFLVSIFNTLLEILFLEEYSLKYNFKLLVTLITNGLFICILIEYIKKKIRS